MLRVIVSFGREDYEHQRFREQGQTAVDERVKLTVSQSLYTLGVQTATAAGTSLVLGRRRLARDRRARSRSAS